MARYSRMYVWKRREAEEIRCEEENLHENLINFPTLHPFRISFDAFIRRTNAACNKCFWHPLFSPFPDVLVTSFFFLFHFFILPQRELSVNLRSTSFSPPPVSKNESFRSINFEECENIKSKSWILKFSSTIFGLLYLLGQNSVQLSVFRLSICFKNSLSNSEIFGGFWKF